MGMKIKDNETGEVVEREAVDAREILRSNPKRYELVPITEGPQNVEHIVEEFKREPVGNNVPKPPTDEDDIMKIRNPVSDQPRMTMPPRPGSPTGSIGVAFNRDVARDMLESQTVAELRETAHNEEIDLEGATVKADIVNKMLRARAKKAKEAAAVGQT